MEGNLVENMNHLKELCGINGMAEFYVLLAGGIAKTAKRIHFDNAENTFTIYNEMDDSWQEDLTEEQLRSQTIVVEAIEKACLYYVGKQLWGE